MPKAFLDDMDTEVMQFGGADNAAVMSDVAAKVQHAVATDRLRVALDYVDSLRALKENWDGYGAAAPDPEILMSAASMLTSYAYEGGVPIPNISPTRTGGILLDWAADAHELEVELVTKAAASYVYLNTQTGVAQEGALFPDSPDDRFFEIIRNYFA
jgi:hypothetical protein